MRLDAALVKRGLVMSRERAQGLIRDGGVTVNGKTVTKNAFPVEDADNIQVIGDDLPYVSRGALKLLRALDEFGVDPSGMVCMDVGASTGGFTQVLLERGAAKVYAIDVGTSQLAPVLREDPRVVVMEQTNARALRGDMFPEKVTLGVMDVSFISIRLILPVVLPILGTDGAMVALIKPQFEAGPKALNKHGVVTDAKVRERVIQELRVFAVSLGWRMEAVIPSPILGGSGNKEFLALLRPFS